MAKALVCEHCLKTVEVRSFRMLASCPHCGGALEGGAAGPSGAAKALYLVDVAFRLVAGLGVSAGGVWFFCAALWNPTSLDALWWQERRGAALALGPVFAVAGCAAAVHAAARLIAGIGTGSDGHGAGGGATGDDAGEDAP